MEFKRQTKEYLVGKEVLAEGYKIFKNDWTTKHSVSEYGKVQVGDVFTVDGEIQRCKWGLHFSKNPLHCFNFYESVQWNKFVKIKAYDKIIDSCNKSVTNCIEIVEIYSFDEFIEEIKKFNINNSKGINSSYGINQSDGINSSKGINYSYGINRSKGINWSYGISDSYGINRSKGTKDSKGVDYSDGINNSSGINHSKGINNSRGINYSMGITYSDGINNSDGISYSKGVKNSYGIDCSGGISYSKGVNNSSFIQNCKGLNESLFCANINGGCYMLFNKQVTEERIDEISSNITWHPPFNNAFELKGNRAWYETNIPNITSVSPKLAYSKMPKDLMDYIKSLPEFDEEIFNQIILAE